MARIVNFADGFTSSSAPSVTGVQQENYPLNNNQSTTDVSGLIFASSSVKSFFANFELERLGSVLYRQTGQLQASFNGSWSLDFGNYSGDSIIDDTLSSTEKVVLTIDATTGQVKYSSGNLTGHTASNLRIVITRIEV